jgi:hypothetical protein
VTPLTTIYPWARRAGWPPEGIAPVGPGGGSINNDSGDRP